MKTTVQKTHAKGLFDNCAKADEVYKDFLLVTRRRVDLEKVNDDIVQ